MPTIGVVAEGVTDQQVLERFLLALCGDDKPVVNFLQPPTPQTPGNWDQVFKYVASERFRGAFQNIDFAVVHVDTDVCESFTPPIRRATEAGEVAADALIEQVRQRLIAEINRNAPGYYERRQSQIIFAIAVHSIECWLLPLFYDRDSQRNRRDNCLALLNQKLSPLGFSIDEKSKGKGYVALLRNDKIKKLKRKAVLEISPYNPGFANFVAQVDALINPAPPAAPDAAPIQPS